MANECAKYGDIVVYVTMTKHIFVSAWWMNLLFILFTPLFLATSIISTNDGKQT